jgi:Transcription initiation factor IID, 18kD subunit
MTRKYQMFVFGEVQDPNSNAVNLVEDIVRSQILEIVRIVVVCFGVPFLV